MVKVKPKIKMQSHGRRKRRLTAYKFFMKVCIKELKGRYPDCTIILPLVSRLCAQTWMRIDEALKIVFQVEADQCEKERTEMGYDDYHIEIPKVDDCADSDMLEMVESAARFAGIGITTKKQKHKKKDTPEKGQDLVSKSSSGSVACLQVEKERQTYVPWRSTKKRKNGRPVVVGGPRRPLSAFVWFCKDERRKVRKKNPGLRMGEISKILGKMWHALNKEEKLKYQVKSQQDRDRYSDELTKCTVVPNPNKKKRPRKKKIPVVKLPSPLGNGAMHQGPPNIEPINLQHIKQEVRFSEDEEQYENVGGTIDLQRIKQEIIEDEEEPYVVNIPLFSPRTLLDNVMFKQELDEIKEESGEDDEESGVDEMDCSPTELADASLEVKKEIIDEIESKKFSLVGGNKTGDNLTINLTCDEKLDDTFSAPDDDSSCVSSSADSDTESDMFERLQTLEEIDSDSSTGFP